MKYAATFRKIQRISDELKAIMDELSAPGPVSRVTQSDINERDAILQRYNVEQYLIKWGNATSAESQKDKDAATPNKKGTKE